MEPAHASEPPARLEDAPELQGTQEHAPYDAPAVAGAAVYFALFGAPPAEPGGTALPQEPDVSLADYLRGCELRLARMEADADAALALAREVEARCCVLQRQNAEFARFVAAARHLEQAHGAGGPPPDAAAAWRVARQRLSAFCADETRDAGAPADAAHAEWEPPGVALESSGDRCMVSSSSQESLESDGTGPHRAVVSLRTLSRG
jgi:hypothetical protein